MIKLAVFAAAVFACSPPVVASTAELDLATPSSADAICHAVDTLEPACVLQPADQPDPGPLALQDPVGLVTGFKDAAVAPTVTLAAPRPDDSRKPLVPALMALAAMVVLLSRRDPVL